MTVDRTILRKIYFVLVFVFVYSGVTAQLLTRNNTHHTVIIPSKKMGLKHKAMIFVPENYLTTTDSFPVVYLLHGYSGYYDNWYIREPKIKQYATDYQMIIVTPEGTFDSWYINSPIDTMKKYKSYIGEEVPNWIDSHYRTIKSKNKTGICGLSMGGHGALTIAIDYPDRFGAASSMSGVLDLRPFSEREELQKLLGDIFDHPSNWFNNSFMGKIYKINLKNPPAIMIDCGEDDKYIDVNKNVHKLLDSRNIPHHFAIKPGNHSWEYWTNGLPEHLLFFEKYFDIEKK